MTKVNSAYVMSCPVNRLLELAILLKMTPKQINHAVTRERLHKVVGTKFDNDPTYRAAYSNGGFEFTFSDEVEPTPSEPTSDAPKGKRDGVLSAKDMLRHILSRSWSEFSLAELVTMTGKTAVNIRTMLSDLKSPVYCGKGGVFTIYSRKVDGVVKYSHYEIK